MDLEQLARVLAFGGSSFDCDYVRAWLVTLVGDTDERVTRWDRLVTDVDAS